MNRTPDQIRDHAVRAFNQLAPAKYDVGQAKSEVTNNLDQHPDLIGGCGGTDGWMVLPRIPPPTVRRERQADCCTGVRGAAVEGDSQEMRHLSLIIDILLALLFLALAIRIALK